MWRDVRQAAYALAHSPIFTICVTLALGLAIGANATMFGLVDALWLRPPGVRDPASLVRVFATSASERDGSWSYPEFEAIGERIGEFNAVVARGRRGAVLIAEDGRRDLVSVNVVSTGFFSTLGVQPAHGRLFGPADTAALEARPGVVLGHAFWRDRLGADPSIVGRALRLDRGTPLGVTVLAVLPETFRDLDAAADRDLWLPTPTWALLAGADEFRQFDFRWLDVIARLRPGASLSQTQSAMTALAKVLSESRSPESRLSGARVVGDFDYRIESGGTNAITLLGLVLLVVLITCVNVANMLLARGSARGREFAIRVALGASRWRLLRHSLSEAALLGGLGALAGLTLAMWSIRILPAVMMPPPGLRSLLVFSTDLRLVTFTLGLTAVTTLLFGVGPSWLTSRVDIAPMLKDTGTLFAPRDRGRLRYGLVIAQVAISLVVLSAAAVLTRSFLATRSADIGFARKPLLVAWVTFTSNGSRAAAAEGVRHLEVLRGVHAVAVAFRAPLSLSGGGMADRVVLEDDPAGSTSGRSVKFNPVSANFFEVFGTPVVRGRPFGPDDERAGEPVAIVNETFVTRFMGSRDPVGAQIRIGRGEGRAHRIVGVVRNAVINHIGEPAEPYFYVPFWRGSYGELTFVIDAPGGIPPSDAVRGALMAVHPGLEPRRLITMGQYVEYASSGYRAIATLAAALGVVGLFLTTLGVYGVVAYRTAARAPEIGIRVALGAAPQQVLSLVAADGLRVSALGLVLGLPAALIVTRLMSSMLFGVGPGDVPAFVAAAVALLVAVSAAAIVPAWRAARIDPLRVLRAG